MSHNLFNSLQDFKYAGKKSRFGVAGATEVAFTAIRNPVNGSEHFVTGVLPTGLLTKKEDFFASETFWVKADGLEFSYPQRHALAFSTVWKGP